jgi:hypothetical protein
MKMNEAEDINKERKKEKSFKIPTTGFIWGPLNFNFSLIVL